MGVDVDAMFEYGYRVSFSDIPDARERFDNEFSDITDESDAGFVTIEGKPYSPDGIVTGDNGYAPYEDQDWYIGVGLPVEVSPEKLVSECREMEPVVRRMYELIMRKPPAEDPKIHVYAQWW